MFVVLIMFVERAIKGDFARVSDAYNIVALVGARQSGKTTFLKEKIKGLNASYVFFDDPDAIALFEEDLKKFEKQYIEGFDIAVLDEVQYCRNAGQKLKYLADSGRKLWITSSSEVLLSKEILSFLVGRVSILKLFPLSLSEFLTAKNQKELNESILERMVWEHLVFGGYPKAVLSESVELKKTILKDLYNTMVLKDIAQTFSIEDIRSLESFSKYLAINNGRIISYEKISNQLNLSFQTVKKYLAAMEKSYLVCEVLPFYSNKAKEITKQPKIYFLDTGMRNAVAGSFNEKNGRLFENYVFSELVKAGFKPKYWRNKAKAEVDFVIEKNNKIIPVEVKIQPTPGRIERGLKSFISAYKPKNAFIVYLKSPANTNPKKEFPETVFKECKVNFVNIKKLTEKITEL